MQVQRIDNSKTVFQGRVHKSVEKFFRSEFLNVSGEEEGVLQNIKEIVSGLHKDTVLKVKKHRFSLIPFRDANTQYLLFASNKNFPNDKYVLGCIGWRTGFFGKICSFIEERSQDIIKTLPHIDEIFVQHAKNIISREPSVSKKASKMSEIEKFAKSANIDPKAEIELNKYPMYSHYYI